MPIINQSSRHSLNILKRLQSYLEPLMFLVVAAWGTIIIIYEILTFQTSAKILLRKDRLSEKIFSKLWLTLNHTIYTNEKDTVVPSLVAKANGTILEIGPGSGNQLSRYDRSKINRIYGVEPNKDLHEQLRANIKKCGLTDIYTIVPCGIEDSKTLSAHGVELNSMDTVLSVQVLCGVPQPDRVVKEMYRLLKPGGQMIVYEHVKSDDVVSGLVQRMYNIVWPFATGGCNLDRPTARYLKGAGEWSRIELAEPGREDAWTVLPRVSGVLVK